MAGSIETPRPDPGQADLFFGLCSLWLVGCADRRAEYPCTFPLNNFNARIKTELSMIGLIIVSHARLADEFRAALEHVMGPQKQIEAISIGAEDDLDWCRCNIIEAINRVDTGDGVAILTDMFGGTPSNLAISCMSRPNVDVLAGLNLPMLVKFAKVREKRSLPEAIAMAQEAGCKYLTIVRRVLVGQ
jgi:mannose PTS system EIIA component